MAVAESTMPPPMVIRDSQRDFFCPPPPPPPTSTASRSAGAPPMKMGMDGLGAIDDVFGELAAVSQSVVSAISVTDRQCDSRVGRVRRRDNEEKGDSGKRRKSGRFHQSNRDIFSERRMWKIISCINRSCQMISSSMQK